MGSLLASMAYLVALVSRPAIVKLAVAGYSYCTGALREAVAGLGAPMPISLVKLPYF